MLVSPTGGLMYHAKAFLYQQTLWKGFRNHVQAWLKEWAPKEDKLLIIGASGGYALDPNFTRAFKQVVAVDPDTLAHRVFQSLHREDVLWITEDFFSPSKSGFSKEGLTALLQRFPDHCVLFSNFLGQMHLLDPQSEYEDSFKLWCESLPNLLEGRSWASFHDRVSGAIEPHFPEGTSWRTSKVLSNNEIIDLFYSNRTNQDVVLTDHLTQDILSQSPRSICSWQITPQRWHLIEWVQQP